MPADDIRQTQQSLLPIQGFWVGPSLPRISRLSITSFLAHGHPYHLYVYDEPTGVPEGCELRDANEILPQRYLHLPLPSFSDWFRYELIFKLGGYYADTDVLCMKPFDIDGWFIGSMQGADVNGAVMKLPPGNWFIWLMRQWCRHPHARLFYTGSMPMIIKFAVGLNRLFRRSVLRPERWRYHKAKGTDFRSSKILWQKNRHDLRVKLGAHQNFWILQQLAPKYARLRRRPELIRPKNYFYPVAWRHWRTLYDDTYADNENPFPDSYGVHLWHNTVRQSEGGGKTLEGGDADLLAAPEQSFFERMCRRYRVE